jgi:hypothetical protein
VSGWADSPQPDNYVKSGTVLLGSAMETGVLPHDFAWIDAMISELGFGLTFDRRIACRHLPYGTV